MSISEEILSDFEYTIKELMNKYDFKIYQENKKEWLELSFLNEHRQRIKILLWIA